MAPQFKIEPMCVLAHMFFLTVEKWFLKRNVAFVNNKGKPLLAKKSVLCSRNNQKGERTKEFRPTVMLKSCPKLFSRCLFFLLRAGSYPFFRYQDDVWLPIFLPAEFESSVS